MQAFKAAKIAYLKLIFTIRKHRLFSIARIGPIYLPKDEVVEQTFKKYIGELYRDGIALEFNAIDQISLQDSGVDCREEFLARGYLEGNKDDKERFVLICNCVDFINGYLMRLYVPDSLGFR